MNRLPAHSASKLCVPPIVAVSFSIVMSLGAHPIAPEARSREIRALVQPPRIATTPKASITRFILAPFLVGNGSVENLVLTLTSYYIVIQD